MKVKFLTFIILIFVTFGIYGKPGDIKYVNSSKATLKASTDFFGKKIGTVSYGEKLFVVEEDAKWTKVIPESNPKLQGWIGNANITSKKILSKDKISSSEIALAGKGFTKSGKSFNVDTDDLNYAAVLRFENIVISKDELRRFTSEGRLTSRKSSRTFKSKVDISENEEYEIGESVAAAILSVYSEQYAPKTKRYLNLIAQTILQASPRPTLHYGYSVGILDTDEINAFATPGGHIMITRGLLLSAKSEDALAAVIAHEIAHIHLQHSLLAIDKSQKQNKIPNRIDSVLSEAFGEDVLEKDNFADEIRNTVNTLVINGYTQPQEFEADLYAVELLDNAGYDTEGIIYMLKTLKSTLNNKIEFPESGFASSHPSPDSRIKNLKSEVKMSTSRAAEKRLERFRNIIK